MEVFGHLPGLPEIYTIKRIDISLQWVVRKRGMPIDFTCRIYSFNTLFTLHDGDQGR